MTLSVFLMVTFVHLLAAVSPGPDFVMVTRQTLVYGKSAGLLCSMGTALGLSVHIGYSAFGVASLVAHSTTALWVLKICGGICLIVLGVQGLRSSQKKDVLTDTDQTAPSTFFHNIGRGFLCNALNPKAPIYFVSLFTIVLSPEIPVRIIVLYGLWMMLLQFSWFALVTLFFSTSFISARFHRFAPVIDRIMGILMIGIGLKVLFSHV